MSETLVDPGLVSVGWSGPASRTGGRWPWSAAAAVVVPALVTVGPWLAGGWVVLLDFGPGPLGSGRILDAGRLPAGPAFTGAVAVVGRLSGERVTAVAVLLVLVALGAGGRALSRSLGCSPVAGSVAAVAASWNPFVFDRLHAGQLATLSATAALLVVAARAVAGRPAGRWVALAAACSVQFLAYGLVVLLVVGTTGFRSRLRSGACALAATAVWVVPLLAGAPPSGGAAAASAFATRADPALGRALGVAVGSGFWRPPAAPVGDLLGAGWVFAVVALLAVAALGLRRLPSRGRGLVAVWVAGWVLAHGTAGPVGAAYRWALLHVPGAGALREAHKAAALVLVAAVAGIAVAVDRPASRSGRRWAVALLGLVVAAAPGQAWGLGGRVTAVDEPAGWSEVRAALADAAAAPDEVVVLPWSSHLRPVLAGGRLVQDPSPGFVVRAATRRTTTGIPGTPETEAGTQARAVAAALADDTGDAVDPSRLVARLGEVGVVWVVVLRDGAGVGAEVRLDAADGVEAVVLGDGIALYRIVAVVGTDVPRA